MRIHRDVIYLICIFMVVILSGGCGVSNFFKMRESDKQYLKSMVTAPQTPEFHRYHIGHNRIRYVEMGPDTLPIVLFIHGAPSSLSFWKNYFRDSTLTSHAKLVAIDRPGYGYSSFGKLYLSYYQQAKLLAPVVEKYGQTNKLIIVGSSYGGPLTALLAAQYSHLVDGVVLISSAIAPGEEAIWNITRVIDSPIGEFFPHVLQIATAEKLNHRRMLEEISGEWEKVVCPVVSLHGTLDDLIYPSNLSFVMKNFTKAPRKATMMGGFKHNIAYGQTTKVVSKIIELIEQE